MDAWTVRRNSRRLHSWWITKKGEPNKTRSYLGGQGKNTKKKEMAHINEKKEEREEQYRIYIKERYREYECSWELSL